MKTFDPWKGSMKSLLGYVLVCCLLGAICTSVAHSAPPNDSPLPQSSEPPPTGGELEVNPAPVPGPDSAPGEALTAPSAPPATGPIESTRNNLLNESFTYTPRNLIDPFVSFIQPAAPPSARVMETEEEETEFPPEPLRPLTPLQKMSIAEIERGLRAITWGELGRKAVIEDASGKGYIVGVGTPAGDKNGMITEIFNDRLVIQQQLWDRKAKRMIAQNMVVKLNKVKEKP